MDGKELVSVFEATCARMDISAHGLCQSRTVSAGAGGQLLLGQRMLVRLQSLLSNTPERGRWMLSCSCVK